YEHELAHYPSLSKQHVRMSCLGQWKSLRNHRLDLPLLKQTKQGRQILSKQFGSETLEPLDAVGDYPFPAREKPAAGNVQGEDGNPMEAIAPTGAPSSQSASLQRGREAVGHHFSTRTDSLARTPNVIATDAIKNRVDPVTAEVVNFYNKILVLVVNRDS